MTTFTSYGGINLNYDVLGGPGEAVVCLPGGPLRAPRYLGDLGGLDAYRKLVVLELPPKRVDRIVADLEALRTHLGQDRLDLLAHSAAGNLALQYAAAHPDRIGKLALVTPGTRAVGIEPSEDDWHAALGRRSDEPWYPDALKAINAWDAGDTSSATQFAAMPFFYGRWDASAQAHAIGEAQEATPDAAAIYYAEGATDPETTRAGLTQVAGEVLVLVGELDVESTPESGRALAALFPQARLAVQPGAGHFPWLDDPAAFVTTMKAFFSR